MTVSIDRTTAYIYCLARAYLFEHWLRPSRIPRSINMTMLMSVVQILYLYALTWHPRWSQIRCNSTQGRARNSRCNWGNFWKCRPTTIHLFLNTDCYIRRVFGWRITATRWWHAYIHSQIPCCQSMSCRMTREAASTIHSIFHCSQYNRTEKRSFDRLKFSFDKMENSCLRNLRKDDNLSKLKKARNLCET